jgi:malonate-semialdehyde dehydrogenase (acetylating)/methylmalonate-semialdehyde dehydrogenase
MSAETLSNYIGGAWIEASSSRTIDVHNPATMETLARVPMSQQSDVDRAVVVAKEAFSTWRQVSPVQRARYLFKYKNLLEENFEEIARTITLEHGKTLDEARGEIRRGIENVEHACGIPTLLMGDSLEDVAAGIDCETVRQPIGVFAAVTPFNFPAMVPLWFWPYAVACGNTMIIKASEQVPLSQQFLMKLAHDAGFPRGVLNMVHGDKEVVDSLIRHEDVAGISFVGSTPVARHVYREAANHGKRVQAFGGAKNHMVVMPDADLDKSVDILVESCFGCAGQRCLAGSVVVAVGDVADELEKRIVARAEKIVVGNGLEPGVTMGPLVSPREQDRIMSMIHHGTSEGARLLLDGRKVEVAGHPSGAWAGPTIFTDVTDDMKLAKDEIFGPVMLIRRVETLDDAVKMIHASEYGNATSVFTQSGKTAREFRYKAGVSMMGVNIGVAAPMAFFPFGGTKNSFFGDTKAHGKDSIRFFTDQKVVISRWF